MNTLLLLILLPLILPWILRMVWPHKISWIEMGVSTAVGVVLAASVYGMGLYGQTADVEILNGQVTSKERTHGSYVRSYECNCRQVCTGTGQNRSCSQVCSTCYEDRYTVNWSCDTTVGSYVIKHLDTTSRSVYNTPDPARYTVIQPGDPVAREHSYTNYVKAVPDSLFHKNKVEKFKSLIPPYPEQVFDFYKINRVFAMGVPVPDLADWNHDLSMALRTLGPQKQANAVIVMVNTNDQSYIHALEGEWIGGKKNDIIVVIGTTSYPKIDWVAVSSWTDKQLFKVQLRDEIMAQGTIDRKQVITALEKHTMSTYVRKSMKDFEYLKHQIEPPTWVLIVAFALSMLTSLGLSFYFYHADPFNAGHSGRFRNIQRRFR
jgi:hypothetical protein